MNLIEEPKNEELVSEQGLSLGFFDKPRFTLDEISRKTDKPVLDKQGNQVIDLVLKVVIPADKTSCVYKVAEDGLLKSMGESYEGFSQQLTPFDEVIQVPITKLYSNAYSQYLTKKENFKQNKENSGLSEAEIELAKVKAQLAEIQAKQSAAALENEAPKAKAPKAKASEAKASEAKASEESEGEKSSNKINIVE